jgi:hypothetical protein
VTEGIPTKAKDAVISDPHDRSVSTPPLVVSSNQVTKAETNDVNVQSTRSNNVRGELEHSKEKADTKEQIQSGETSKILTTEHESTKQANYERPTIKSSFMNKDCPKKSIEMEDSNRSNSSSHTHVSPSASPKLFTKSPKVPRANKSYSLMSGSSNKDRPCSNNIASLRKIFERESSSSSRSPDIVEEERDEFPIVIPQEEANKRPEPAKPRLGLRPMSFMCAMDAAEDSPLIPDENDQTEKKRDNMLYESSA